MHKSGFYPRLALTNILRNGQFYLPYFLTCMGAVAMFYILGYLAWGGVLDGTRGADTILTILNLGCIVVGLFSVVLICYANGFIMKRRRRELGLYNILGMERRHIARLLCCETFLLGAASMLCGLAAGILLSKLILALLLKLLHFVVPMGFSVSVKSAAVTAVLFAAIFLVVLLGNLFRIHLARPVELLRSGSVGEREPRTRWLLAVLGVVTLAGGYVIANLVEDPLAALLLFFVAVILVMIGTYCLFAAGSIAFLKRLRANKRYYYRPSHFTAVSGMLYRMKQNSVGLASICILSTMVLVTVSTTVCMYLGTENALKSRYPADISIVTDDAEGEQTPQSVRQTAEQTIRRAGRNVLSLRDYTYLGFTASLSEDTLELNTGNGYIDSDSFRVLVCVAAEEYNRLTGKNVTLAPDEVLCCNSDGSLPDTFRLENTAYRIAGRPDDLPVISEYVSVLSNVQFLVMRADTMSDWDTLQQAAYGENAGKVSYEMDLNIDGTDEEKIDCYKALRDAVGSGSFRCRQEAAADFYALNGGCLFLGLFLGLLFGMATVLMIYYKQVSEGYEDQRRFEIMQQVGMSRQEVQHSVGKQILLVFFLPLVTAGVHILFAFHMITKILLVFALTDLKLFALCVLGTFLIFGTVYALVYWATARAYYKIVRTPCN